MAQINAYAIRISARTMTKTVHKSVSIPVSMQEFLDENPDLSVSKMLQSKIMEIQENRRIYSEDFHKKDRVIKHMQNLLFRNKEEIDNLKKCLEEKK